MATIVDDSNSNLLWSGNSWNTDHSDDVLTGRYFNSGLYGVVIDGGDIQYFSGFSQEGQFQATLFATNGLADGSHTLKISNENQRNTEQYPDYVYLDIDSVAVNGDLINAASSDSTSLSSSSSSMSVASSTSVSSSNLSESSDISSGQYSNTVSSATIVSTASETPNSSSTSRIPSSAPLPTDSSLAESTATAGSGNQSNDRKTITLAISIPVIVISSIVIFIFVAVYFWKRRQKKYERQYDNHYNGYMDEQQSSWR
ncbi:uncharacterized protein I303_100517 [Kwoniella dejecticola CBS 10117]|uniref:Uncharacterized protein n=1 Tax=Kwoniella dejecticola CBS 10117 TaxID=1296121 RepID=A0A1A6AF51_9TREE|nr:uncharacterized protein I303_00517 [Kwoniella dejecticola CBS 10117]OBR88700.1 hypothetical protein I303_00517 [Kwoniella dejecticola CBS 10117]